ncbi:MAG: helix-turn-helix domain-containing protein [Nostoc sp.]|uniref:helix-turn-helix domain-containing protein n=1 Tax=Nostoc sp. TaxID=1180 RepID=UPI002FF3EAF5
MARSLKIVIEESVEFLDKQLKQTRTARQRERIEILWWLKTGQVKQHQELAHRLGRDTSTVTRWLQKYRHGGLSELLEVKTAPGQTPHLTSEALTGLKERLKLGVGFKSYGEIVEWLKTEYGLELTYATVYSWVHYRLKAKLKVPRPHSAKQDVVAVERFKKTSSRPC